MSPEIQEWSHKSRSRINNLYLLTRPITTTTICCLSQILSGHFKHYARDPWNLFDQLMYTVLLIAVILRFALTNSSYFVWARYVYSIDLIMFYLRILQLFYIHPHLGPKVIVIWRMVCVIIS